MRRPLQPARIRRLLIAMGRFSAFLCLSLSLAMSCDDEEPTLPDASAADGGTTRDASVADAETEADAGALDAESPDADAPDAAPTDVGTSPSWERPACAQITGTAGFSFTADEGHTL